MGVDLQGIRLLSEYRKNRELGDVVTLGRQGISLYPEERREASREYGISMTLLENDWSESLLIEHFGAKSVTSIDCSDYEGATIVHDMNTPVRDMRQFDTVLDFGTSEHIFDVKTVFGNIKNLCKPGGSIIHFLPANNFCGHGFYQFSPIFFRSLYDEKSGIDIDAMYLAKMATDRDWYRVNAVASMDRFVFYNDYPTTILVITTKRGGSEKVSVQQTDYLNRWEGNDAGVNLRENQGLRKIKYLLLNNGLRRTFEILESLYRKVRPYHGYSSRLDGSPYVVKDNMK